MLFIQKIKEEIMNYIQTIRKLIGNEMLMTVGCGIILEQENKILLQHRTDRDVWGIPGGLWSLEKRSLKQL